MDDIVESIIVAIAFVAMVIVSAMCSGCGTIPDWTGALISTGTNAVDGVTSGTTTTTVSTGATTTTTEAANSGDIALTVTSLSASKVGFAWSPASYGWPSKTVKVLVDAEVHMYRADGSGGKFDWIRAGGQETKGLENVHDGYGCWSTVGLPAAGEVVTFQWVSIDGRKKSNRATATWPTRSWWRCW
jgi:hypothetical protein